MAIFNSDPSDHSDRVSASQAFLDALVALDETFGDSSPLDLAPDPTVPNRISAASPSLSSPSLPTSDQPSDP
ncbi:MAG: hypothetical protein HC795_05005 [Coleofasciculaceae cyanobacterium RL_1_1]|nr:hypothetical protein [Coleofasciculaceae cyanobacterium RL_1_1]